MKDSLTRLCKQHDEIKNCKLRFATINSEEILPDSAKDQYYSMLDNLVSELLNYIDKYKDEEHVRFSLRYGIVRGNIPKFFKRDLYKSYAEQNDWIDFLAETEYKILTKAHILIEYMYHLLTNEWYTDGFEERIIRG